MALPEPHAAERSHQTKGLLRLTMACNERCTFCNVPVEDYDHPTPTQAVIDSQLEEFLERGDKTLTISGGEPTLLRRRLIALITRARQRGIQYVELQTNAVLVTQDYANALVDAGLTSAFISLLSHRAESHDALTLLEGSFEKCLQGIDHLLAAGVRVTLNPVVAHETQTDIANYIDFVAQRLPKVRSISLSAVQPHGRAGRGDGPALLPDYAILRRHIPKAIERAHIHGIELLNPYCGVPLCVGWVHEIEKSVEAIEALQGGWRPTPGIENQGDKVQGEPCRLCAVRTRCGGAWRAYWDVRNGSGIIPPLKAAAPWDRANADDGAQVIVRAIDGPDSNTWKTLSAADTPTVWLHTNRLRQGDADKLAQSGCTDLAIELNPKGVHTSHTGSSLTRTLHELRQVLNLGSLAQPQGRLRTWLALYSDAPKVDLEALIQWARAHGVAHIRLISGEKP